MNESCDYYEIGFAGLFHICDELLLKGRDEVTLPDMPMLDELNTTFVSAECLLTLLNTTSITQKLQK
jgi:hypothetical protein